MRLVTCSMGMSLDGYATGPDGGLDWSAPDDELFAFVTEEIQHVGVHLLGRRLHEDMLVWEGADTDPGRSEEVRAWAAHWAALDKVVVSSTLTSVPPGFRLATGSLAEEVARLREEPGPGAIAVGGATLAAAAAELGLVDEYRVRVFPVLVGGGTPLFPQHGTRTDLELLDRRTFASGVTYLRYRVRHERTGRR